MTTKKSWLKYGLILLIIVAAAIAAYAYFSKTNYLQLGGSVGTVEAIGDNGVYVNEKYGFGMMFPKYWAGSVAQEKDGGVEFSLRDMSGKSVPIFRIQSYSDAEYAKVAANPADNAHMPYFIAYDNGSNFAYFLLVDDGKRKDFADPFSSEIYKGFSYDVENNITPTFKFAGKDEVSDLRDHFQKSNEFRLMDIKPKDKVGGMEIISIAPFSVAEGDDSATVQVRNVSIKFSGETTLTGTYENGELNPAIGSSGLVCMRDLDEASKQRIPNLLWSDEMNGFCFSNQDFAKQSFAPAGSTGEATVVVDDYTVNKIPAPVTDVARLVRVEEKK